MSLGGPLASPIPAPSLTSVVTVHAAPRPFYRHLTRPSTTVSVAAVGAVAAAAFACWHPLVGVGVLLLAILLLVVARWPGAALVTLFAVLPLHLFFYGLLVSRAHLSPQPFTYWKDIVVAGLLVQGLVGNWRRHHRILPRAQGDRLLLLLVLVYVIVAVASPDPNVAKYALALDTEGPVLLVAVVLLAPQRRWVVAALAAISVTAVVLASIGIAEQSLRDSLPHFFGRDPASEVDYHTQNGYRSGSLLGDPLIFSFFLAAATPVVAAVTVGMRGPWRVVALVGFGVCLIGTVVTYTRSAYVGVIAGVAVCLAGAVRRRRIRASLIAGFVVAALGVAAVAAIGGDDRLLHLEDNQVHADRLAHDLDLLAAQPFGYGLGRFDYVGRRFDTPEAQRTSATESLYLARALETGVIGLALYVAALFTTAIRVLRARRRALQRRDRLGVLLGAAALGSLLAVSLAGLNLPVQFLAIDAVVWGTCGLAIAQQPTVSDRQTA